ncbi:hypothetical protein HK405_001270, partial [Cladochytrium tenue]
ASSLRGLTVVLTGGSGFVGAQWARELLRPDHAVGRLHLWCRPSSKLLDRSVTGSPLVTVHRGGMDVGDDGPADAGIERADVFLHCAADTKFEADDATSRAANVDLLARSVAAARRAGARLFVHVSSVYVFLYLPDGAVVPENVRPDLHAHGAAYFRSKARAEDLIREAAAAADSSGAGDGGMDFAIMRLSTVGPSLESPFPGWATRTGSPVTAALHSGMGELSIGASRTLDVVPVDMASAMATAALRALLRRPPGFGLETFNVCAGTRRDRLLPLVVLQDRRFNVSKRIPAHVFARIYRKFYEGTVVFENGKTLAAAQSEGLPDSILEIDWNDYLATASNAIKTPRTKITTMERARL